MPTDGSTLDNPTKTEWRTSTVGECAIINPDAYSPKEAWPFINYLDTGSVTENLVADIQRLTPGEDKIPPRARRKVKRGDIVYSTVRPNQKHYGIIKDIPDNFLASTGFAVIRVKQDIADTGFIYYFLTQAHIVEYLHTIAEESMTAYPAIRPSDIERLEISLPPLPTQRAIAGILGAFDDKIALNAKMNATLESMAQALFQAWFVNFEPVRAKRSGQWRRGQTLPGMPAALYDLFPAELTPTELGDAPAGWELRTLGEIGDIVTGKTPSTRNPSFYGNDMPFLKIPDMRDKVYVAKTATMLSNQGAASQPKKALPAGSVSVSCIATPGLVVLNHRETHTNQQINSIVPRKDWVSKYLYWACRNISNEIMIRGSGGTVFINLNKTNFSTITILYPKDELIQAFDEIVTPFHDAILSNEQQSLTLADMRDTLLPKLLSGEVRVE